MEGFWTTALGGALGNVLSALLGIVVTGVTTMGGFYISKLSKKLKMDSLEKEIFRLLDGLNRLQDLLYLMGKLNYILFSKTPDYTQKKTISV